jgi:hypothetical protein
MQRATLLILLLAGMPPHACPLPCPPAHMGAPTHHFGVSSNMEPSHNHHLPSPMLTGRHFLSRKGYCELEYCFKRVWLRQLSRKKVTARVSVLCVYASEDILSKLLSNTPHLFSRPKPMSKSSRTRHSKYGRLAHGTVSVSITDDTVTVNQTNLDGLCHFVNMRQIKNAWQLVFTTLFPPILNYGLCSYFGQPNSNCATCDRSIKNYPVWHKWNM